MRRLLSLLSAMVAITAVMTACANVNPGPGPEMSLTPAPTLTTPTQPTARPALVIQFCDDDTGSYPRGYFRSASKLIASSLIDSIRVNQQGVTLYATAITHNTFDPSNTLSPVFTIPAIPAYGAAPTPVPLPASTDPFTYSATQTTVASRTSQGISAYNASIVSLNQTVATVKASELKDTQRLIAWNPPVDYAGTSILGCFQLAAERFQNTSGTRLIYIASDLANTTDIDYTQTFLTSHALAGAIVHVIFFYSTDAAIAQRKESTWCPYLHSAGAKAIIFSDPLSSPTLSDAFDKDQSMSARAC